MGGNSYEYTPLVDLNPGAIANVYGVVTKYYAPKQTKGTDLMMTITIVDHSLPENSEGVQLILFKRAAEMLPQINRVGDIIRCHRLKIQKFENIIQGTVSRGFSWIIVDGEVDAPLDLRVSPVEENGSLLPTKYTFTEQDDAFIKMLREWSSKQTHFLSSSSSLSTYTSSVTRSNYSTHPFTSTNPSSSPSSHSRAPSYSSSTTTGNSFPSSCRAIISISKVINGVYFDCLVRVVAIANNVSSNPYTIVVSDFSTSPLLSPYRPDSQASVTNYIESSAEFCQKYVLPLVLWDEHGAKASKNVGLNDILYVTNVRSRRNREGFVGVLHGSSAQGSLHVIDLSCPPVVCIEPLLELQQREILLRKTVLKKMAQEEKSISSDLYTMTVHTCVKPVTVQQVLECSSDVGKFKIRAKVVGFSPAETYFTRLYCSQCQQSLQPNDRPDSLSCPSCENDSMQYIYAFSIFLEDQTGQLEVIVYRDDANHFLKNLPPVDLLKSTEAIDKLQATMQKLVAAQQPSEFCVKRYRIVDRDGYSLLKYRLFDTVIL